MIVLLRLPLDTVFRVGTNAQKKQQARLTRFKAYISKPQATQDLRVACLCLRMTTVVTSMVSKQKDGTGTILLALARGEPQHKAGEVVSEQLQQLCYDKDLPWTRALVNLFPKPLVHVENETLVKL